jgi:uncharacterized protein YigE (DUF2233 family)
MKTNLQSRATNGMFLLNNYSISKSVSEQYFKNEKQLQAADQATPMIESIIETIVEPIIFKC